MTTQYVLMVFSLKKIEMSTENSIEISLTNYDHLK